jgi:hypothetical protein
MRERCQSIITDWHPEYEMATWPRFAHGSLDVQALAQCRFGRLRP